jgi:hypothetical protein
LYDSFGLAHFVQMNDPILERYASNETPMIAGNAIYLSLDTKMWKSEHSLIITVHLSWVSMLT